MSRHVTGEVLQTFSLQLIGSRPLRYCLAGLQTYEEREGIPPWTLRETEENLSDLLPEGYSVRIREWDAEEETPNA